MTERPAPPPEVSQVDPEGPPGRTFRTWVGRLLAIAVDALYRTVRVHSEGRAAVDSLRARGEGYAYGFWHGRQLLLLGAHRRERCTILVSLSRDGDVQAAVCRHFGYSVVRGSTSRRGRRGLWELSQQVAQGCHPAIALDGPRGPSQVAQPGLLALARHHDLWVVPLASACRSSIRLRSWDRTTLPLPFTRGRIVYGEPFRVRDVPGPPRGATERATRELQRRLDEAQARADRPWEDTAGSPPPEP